MRMKGARRWSAAALVLALLAVSLGAIPSLAEAGDAPRVQLVLTLGADLSASQRGDVLEYFGISENQAKVITITNADEREQLGNLVADDVIGTHTLSCALIRLTSSGGIQVKTANMSFVTSNMIASTLSTSGVYNCEVLTVAPFEVSGTGALTGVMMAYEAGTGQQLDPVKKDLANEELVITGEIADSVGQDQATLVVNDIKIHIVRDAITDQEQVNEVVDEVIDTTQTAAAEAAEREGKPAPVKLGTVETQRLYNFGYKFSQIGYSYSDMAPTLERVTRNITKSTGIQDPITDTFITEDDADSLSIDSILLGTQDSVLGDDAIINATNSVALGDHPAEPIDIYTGDVRLTESGKVKAEKFISGSNVVAYKEVGGQYALMDLNGNTLTQPVYTDEFQGRYGCIEATLAGDDGYEGVLNSDGAEVVPFKYDVANVLGELWGVGITLKPGTQDDYDYYSFSGKHFQIDTVDVYYFGSESGLPVSTLSRSDYADAFAFGDYLNIENRSGVVTTYDSQFNVVQNPDSLYDSSYDESYRAANILSEQMDASVSRFHGNYANIYRDGKYGLVDRYGNIIIPEQFDSIYTSNNDAYISGGYAGAKLNDQFVYTVPGGQVTATFSGVDYINVNNYGLSAYTKNSDNSYTLLSGDGVTSQLSGDYTYLYPINESEGMLWKAQLSNYKYDLIDWHGNVLLSGADDYSVSANGNYLIAQNGYTSSTLYIINDASPVMLSQSAGGAVELTAQAIEGASLAAYTGDPSVQLLGEVPAVDFLDGTNLIIAEDSVSGAECLMDVSGRQLTEPAYDSFTFSDGWVIATGADTGKVGLLSMNGAQAIPCEYDVLDVQNEHWALAYTLVPTATEADNDYYGWNISGNRVYYYIEEVTICHLSPDEVSSVTLTRDQFAEAQANEDYINVEDRSSGVVTTYDSTFTSVATVDRIWDFEGLSSTTVRDQSIRDKTGYTVSDSDFPDGYSRVADFAGNASGDVVYGVCDAEGNVVVPVIYDDVETSYSDRSHIWANGYFCVTQDDMCGYVTEGGEVSCPIQYPKDNFENAGMSANFTEADGTHTLVAADGTVTKGYSTLSNLYSGYGKFWRTASASGYDYNLIDWHGNVLFEDVSSVHVSQDGDYILVQEEYGDPYKLYGVDGASPEGGFVGSGAAAQGNDSGTTSGSTRPTVEAMTTPEPTATPAAEPTPEVTSEPTAEPAAGVTTAPSDSENEGQNASGALALLTSADSLVNADLATNQSAILTLLEQAKLLLDAEHPDAAAMVSSAITLLNSGSTDAGTISTLLQATIGMLG